MAKEQVIDIGKRLRAAFGLISANVSNELDRAGFKEAIASAEVFVQDSRTSFEEILLINGDTRLKFGGTNFIKDQPNIYAPPPMVSFRKYKRMEETVMNTESVSGEIVEGEVVEHYGHAAWDISIQGILVDMENHVYPSEKVRQLIDLFDTNAPWDVESLIFQDHKIKSIYFREIEDSGVQGFQDTWSYTLSARSIKPAEFFLKQKK